MDTRRDVSKLYSDICQLSRYHENKATYRLEVKENWQTFVKSTSIQLLPYLAILKSVPTDKCPSLKYSVARISAKNKRERNKMKQDIDFILKNCPQHLIGKEITINDYYDEEDEENPFQTSSPDRKARPFSIRGKLGEIQQDDGKLR